MANHKFHGDWTYYDVNPDGSVPQPETLKLVIPDATGKLKAGSKKKFDLTGEAGATNIEMKEYNNAAVVDVDFTGHLIVNDPKRLVLVGRWVDNNALALKRKSADFDGQEEGTWVATKP